VALFPTLSHTHSYPKVEENWNTTISDMQSGKENRTQVWAFPKRTISVNLPGHIYADLKLIRDFYNNTCKGARYTFRFKYDQSRAYAKEYAGLGDSTTKTFTIPSIDASSNITAYVNDVVTGTSFGNGTGSDGLDQMTFASAPANGSVVTVSFTGKWTPQVRFPDKLSWQQITSLVSLTEQINLIEVRD